jgi:putative OPT family oligopeptide transporter
MLKETPHRTETAVAEMSFRAVVLAILLTIVLAVSNAYLALKLGILTSASIPAAMISIGILRFFKNPTLLENNAVQTAASAGEAVAGGIVYTIPGLIVIGFWHQFDYFTNFLIALCGGVLGVLFSIPLRRILVNDRALRFPEGHAIAQVLKSTVEKTGLHDLVYGGLVGAVLEFCQLGLKVIANGWQYWFVFKRSLFALGAGFSATMIGAGFLMGFDLALSIGLGAVFAWLIALPIVSQYYPDWLHFTALSEGGAALWNSELRYMGIGAMLFAGVWTFIKLFRPLLSSIYLSLKTFRLRRGSAKRLPRTDRDISIFYLFMGICLALSVLFLVFQFLFPLDDMGLPEQYGPTFVFIAVVYVLLVGFLFSVITAYFSGMVGVSASPGSSVVIAGVLLAAYLLLTMIRYVVPLPLTSVQITAAEAVTIMIGSVVTGIAAIANDNSQDLKVGQLVGATPWRQQVMLLLGVLVSALVIPWVMQLMFSVYGIAGVMPHNGMDVSQSLPAPTAALLAAVTDAVFQGNLPWMMMALGCMTIASLILVNRVFRLYRKIKLSMLGVAIGMYLPLTTTFPLFVGGLIALWVQQSLHLKVKDFSRRTQYMQRGVLIACGLVAGAALMDVFLALAFSLSFGPDSLSLVGEKWDLYGLILGVLSLVLLAWWVKYRVCRSINI